MSSAIELAGITKSFSGVRANDGISLAIDATECHAIIGPNGAGKTTLVGQIAGEIAPDAGRISMFDADITRWPTPRRALAGLARSFQITQLLSGFSVEDNVALAIQARQGHSFRFFGDARRDRRLRDPAEHVLERVGLAEKANVPVEALSHGERRQLEIAIALACTPKVMLLDEPIAGLGAVETARMIEILAAIKGSCAIAFIEHDMDAVFALADRISVMVAGRIIRTGRPAEIRADPTVRAAYLGDEGA
jgi:branched-chain amino acid transport system ATP-binding protein